MKKYLPLICSLFVFQTLFSQQWMGSTRISGAGNEISEIIISDEIQNTYVSGNFTQEITFSTDTIVSKGASDIFVVKYNDNNEILWKTTIGSKSIDYLSNITLNDEALFVAGCFSDSCVIGKDTLVSLGSTDIFLAKYDKQTGTAINAFHVVGGSGMLLLTGLSTDNSGNILISGILFSGKAGFPPFDNDALDGASGFFAKYDTEGNYLWHVTLSNSSFVSNAVTTDNDYYVVNTGKENIDIKDASGTSHNIQSSSDPVNNIQLISLDTNGLYQWSEISSSQGATSVKSIKMDAQGALLMAGLFENGDLSFAGNSLNINNISGTKDIYIISATPSENAIDDNSVYAASISSPGDDVLYGLELHGEILYVIGKINGSVIFNKDEVAAGMFVASYTMDDEAKSFDPVGAVSGIPGAYDAKGVIFSSKGFKITGGFNTNIIIGEDTYTNGGGIDTYLAKACPIIAIDTFDFKHVSGCDALAKNGEVKIDIKGGVTASSYILMKDGFGEVANQSSNYFTSLDTGKYTVTVLYNDGYCSKDLPFTVKAPESLSFRKVILPELPCDPNAKGNIEVSVNNPTGAELEYYARAILPSNGGTQIYFSDWRDGQADTAMFVNCPLGQYFLRVRFKDDATCDTVYKTSVSPKETGIISASTEDYICHPDNVTPSGSQGRVTVNVDDAQKGEWFALIDVVSGATVQAKSVETPGRTSYTFEERVSAGTYVTLAGQSGSLCMLSDTVTVEQPDPIIVQSVKASGALCYGETSGKITIAALGSSDTLSYELFIKNDDESYTSVRNGRFSERVQVINLLAGTYKLELTDLVDGVQTCAYSYPSEIIVPNVGTEFGLAIADSSSLCFGTTNSGYIRFNLTGGTSGKYTYTLTGGSNPPQNINGIFNNLPAGTYQATVTEQDNGCVYTYPEAIELIQFPEIIVGAVAPKDVLCNGENTGEISIASISGGSGNYTIIATDTISSVPYTATGVGPYKIEGLIEGTYAISIKDNETKCIPSPLSNVTIGEPDVLEFESRTKEDIKCNGELTGKVIVAAKGGKSDALNPYQYTLTYGAVSQTHASGTFDNLAPGFYSVTVEDNNHCTANTGALEITQPAPIEIVTVTPTDVICFDESNGSIRVANVTGGTTLLSTYTYTLSNVDGSSPVANGTNPLFAGLKAQSYKLSVTDDYNCLKEMSPIVINQPEKLLVSGDLNIKPESCKAPDGTIQVTVTGGTAPYSFSSGGNYSESQYASTYKFSGLTADQYTVNVKDKNGCMIDPMDVTVEKNSLTAGAMATEIMCFKDRATLIVNASSSHDATMRRYSLYKDGTLFKEETAAVFDNLDVGTYYVAVEDTNSCTVTTPEVVITKPEQMMISIDVKSASKQTVADGALTIKVSGGTPFDDDKYKFVLKLKSDLIVDMLTSSPHTFDNLLPAEYGIEIWDKNDCSVGTVDEVDIKTGIRNKDVNELKIYPNPSDGKFYVQWNHEKDMSLNVEIFNMSGKLIYKNVLPVGAGTTETLINISGQPQGTYIMHVKELNVRQKLIIQ